MEKIITISPFATSANCGHPIIDDQFYFDYLTRTGREFKFYTSKYSADLIQKNNAEAHRFIKIINPISAGRYGIIKFLWQIKVPKCSKVIIFLYTEELVFFFLLINIFKKYDLYLVSSNNISARRCDIYKLRLKLFFWLTNFRLSKLIVDTQHQLDLINSLCGQTRKKSCTRKNHLMCVKHVGTNQIQNTCVKLSYFGPPKTEKPIDLVLELIAADKEQKIKYHLYNVDLTMVLQELGLNSLPSNVCVDESWRDYSDYLLKFKESDIVFLTHSAEFGGKLSGNLCDCFALGVPYISLPIEPVLSFQKLHGEMGIICDPKETKWCDNLLFSLTRYNISFFKNRIQQVQSLYTIQAAHESLDEALDFR